MNTGDSYQFAFIHQDAQAILTSGKSIAWKERMLWQRKNHGFTKPKKGAEVLRLAGKCVPQEAIHTEDFTSESMCKTNISRRWKDRKIKRDEESARLLLLCK